MRTLFTKCRSVFHTQARGSPLSFRLPSEVHSALYLPPQFHRLRLSLGTGTRPTYSPSSVWWYYSTRTWICQGGQRDFLRKFSEVFQIQMLFSRQCHQPMPATSGHLRLRKSGSDSGMFYPRELHHAMEYTSINCCLAGDTLERGPLREGAPRSGGGARVNSGNLLPGKEH